MTEPFKILLADETDLWDSRNNGGSGRRGHHDAEPTDRARAGGASVGCTA